MTRKLLVYRGGAYLLNCEEIMKLRNWLSGTRLAVVVILSLVLPASATFPGKNGRIAFVQGPDIYTMHPDGSDVRQLTSFTDGGGAFWVNWSADSTELVFSRFSPPDFLGQMWLMNADGSNQRLLFNDPGFDDEAPSFSPDGRYVIFQQCAPLDGEFPCTIHRVGVDGSGLVQITPVRIELSDQEPVYSPDGNTIAFWSFGRDGVIAAVYSMNSDGSGIRELSDPELEGFAPSWSPDGRQLVFTTKCCNPELSNLEVMKRNGEEQRQITQDHGVMGAGRSSWSPQGDAIVFRSTNASGQGGIFVMKADGSETKLILNVQATVVKHGLGVRSRTHAFKNKKGSAATQIEDGGALPRWGSAQ
jgi:Tol biopolymer transport system component